MKFIVDSLPYYREKCPFENVCVGSDNGDCPRYWDKYHVCGDENPHECYFLKEQEVHDD